jgi:transcriptional regulator with GAF, ATPase, and Fis domain
MASNHPTSDVSASSNRAELTGHADGLRRQESWYWHLLAAWCVVATAGMGFALAPLPWVSNPAVLVTGLSGATLLVVTYLTVQKGRMATLRRRVEQINHESVERQRQNAARLRALLNVSRMMGSLAKLENLFASITKTCVEVFECQQATLMMINEQTGVLEVRAATGHAREHELKKATLKVGEGIAGWVAEKQSPLILNKDTDPSRYPGLPLKDPSISAAMVVPIVLRDELVGVLNVSSRLPDARYSDDDLQALLVFAENAGTCIRHTEHVEWMRNALHDTMEKSSRTPAPKPNEAPTIR